uniref:PID domain-containing protein n=1 Tax=Eptatretus burgeri TaxID=7764 RepID=A0A8C4QIT3_EPTBU
MSLAGDFSPDASTDPQFCTALQTWLDSRLHSDLNPDFHSELHSERTQPRTQTGFSVSYLGKERLPILTTFTPGCTSTAVEALCTRATMIPSYLNLRPFILRLRPVATAPTTNVVKADTSIQHPVLTFEVSRIAFCSAEHLEHPAILAWVYRETEMDVDPQLWCHAVECECPVAARRLAHTMMKAFQCTLRGMKSQDQLPRHQGPEDSDFRPPAQVLAAPHP